MPEVVPAQATAHVKPPQQARSRRTLERIVRAALELLEEEGPDGVTVQAVVARARSSVGSFYARFGGKEDLLEYLEERVWKEAEERWQTRLQERDWSALSLEELVRGAVRLLADARRSRASYLKTLDRMGAGSGDGYASFRRYVLSSLAELLLERRTQIRHPHPDIAVRLSLAAIAGVVDTGDPATGEPFNGELLAEEGTALALAYLTGDAKERVTAGPGWGDADSGAQKVSAATPDAAEISPAVADTAEAETTREPEPTRPPEPTRGSEARDEGEAPDDDEEDGDVDFFDVWG